MKRIALILCLVASPTLAQPAQPQQPSAEVVALSQRLSAEIGTSLQAAATVIDLQRQLAAAQAEIKDLKAKAVREDAPTK